MDDSFRYGALTRKTVIKPKPLVKYVEAIIKKGYVNYFGTYHQTLKMFKDLKNVFPKLIEAETTKPNQEQKYLTVFKNPISWIQKQ